ncbi:MAG: 30S ribosomal protein S9 [Clostridiales bacterium]|jgi:small subunit ribosomal protein S9|nr:30S ribosomal protein S9 [Clostridiales bacterium]
MDNSKFFYGTGRRKTSVARVRLYPSGTGVFEVNGKKLDEYFGLDTLKLIVKRPFVALNKELAGYDVRCSVKGGGVTGQAGAICHGLARAFENEDAENRKLLKPAKLLTRDSRMKERKKYGLKAARRAPQFSKR